jgi:hypothetical protein
MPSVFFGGKSAAPQFLDGDPQRQMAALWGYLSAGSKLPLPSLAPPAAAIVAGGENPRYTPREKSMIVRGFMPGTAGMKGIAVGTPAGMHFAFDSERCALMAVWTGDFAEIGGWYDNGRGKPEENGLKPLGKIIWRGAAEPVFSQSTQAATEPSSIAPRFRAIATTKDGATVEYELPLAGDKTAAVKETWTPLTDRRGFERTLELSGDPSEGLLIVIGEGPSAQQVSKGGWVVESGGQFWNVKREGGDLWLGGAPAAEGRARLILAAPADSQVPANGPIRITYTMTKPSVLDDGK